MSDLKDRVDMRALVVEHVGQPKTSTGKYDLYRCPFHRETKGYSFVVYDTHAQCLGKCGKSWDCYQFVMDWNSVSFSEAKNMLQQKYGIGTVPAPRQTQEPRSTLAPASEPPSDEWQTIARRIVDDAQTELWHPDNAGKALAYLRKRGLNDETIKAFNLGYIPGHYDAWQERDGLKVPCGITIPWFDSSDNLWAVKVRRAGGNQRYHQISGGNAKGGLFGAQFVVAGQPLIIDEGEFNAMIIHQCNIAMSATAIGSVGNKNINQRWFGVLASAPVIYARMDLGSGDDALMHLKKFSNAVKPLICPSPHKDPNDFYLADGDFGIWAWANGGRYAELDHATA